MRKITKTWALLLAAVLLLAGPAACGQKEKEELIRQVGAYKVVVNKDMLPETYPYMLKTENSVWYLSADDIALLGEDAFYEGLEDILQYLEADTADARAGLKGRIPDRIEAVEIRTDFCGKAAKSENTGAYYNARANFIKLFHNWDAAKEALLHEYVHYLTFHCAEKKTLDGFFAEAAAEYDSKLLCENRMARSVLYGIVRSAEEEESAKAWGLWDEEKNAPDYLKVRLAESDIYGRGALNGKAYFCCGQYMHTRSSSEVTEPNELTYSECLTLAVYLMETYGTERFLDSWDAEPDKLPELYGMSCAELMAEWRAWVTEQIAAQGIRMGM